MSAPGPDVMLLSTPARHRAARGFSLIELIVVLGLAAVLSAMAVPMMKAILGDFSLTGDARGVSSAVSLAKLRAAASFSQARVFVDLDGKTYRVELWQKTPPKWVTEGGIKRLSTTVNFGFGIVGSAPPFSQATIVQASECVNDLGAAIGRTACILFNSRGIPVDPGGAPPSVGAPTGNDAVYLTDAAAVYAVTISATGLIKLWRSLRTANPSWVLQ
jgi:prepilin-type N-terminal cleavage/methylation domain-containing protein